MFVHKIMTAGCRLRMALIILISLAAGFVTSITMDSVYSINCTKEILTQDTLKNVLWLEGADTENHQFSPVDKFSRLKSIDGIDDISIQVNFCSESSGESIFAISQKLLFAMQLPVSSGEWFSSKTGKDIVPAIVSYDLAEKYPVGDMVTIDIRRNTDQKVYPTNIRVIGILHQFGGLPNLDSGQFVTYPSLLNNVYWHNLNNTFILPLERLPLKDDVRSYDILPTAAVHMSESVAHDEKKRMELQRDLYQNGMGMTNTGYILSQRTAELDHYDTGRQRVMIYLFLGLTTAGILCYNIVYAYHKKRELSVLRLLGATKKRLALNWTIMAGYAHLLPLLFGLSLGQGLISNGSIWFPYQQVLNRNVLCLGCFVFLAAVFCCAYWFFSKDVSGNLKEA